MNDPNAVARLGWQLATEPQENNGLECEGRITFRLIPNGEITIILFSLEYHEEKIVSTIAMTVIEIHQIEGFDPQGRSFNRNVEVRRSERGFTATFHYEGIAAESDPHVTIQNALADLAKRLQAKGFIRLRTRVNFKGKRYLAERQAWVNYSDP